MSSIDSVPIDSVDSIDREALAGAWLRGAGACTHNGWHPSQGSAREKRKRFGRLGEGSKPDVTMRSWHSDAPLAGSTGSRLGPATATNRRVHTPIIDHRSGRGLVFWVTSNRSGHRTSLALAPTQKSDILPPTTMKRAASTATATTLLLRWLLAACLLAGSATASWILQGHEDVEVIELMHEWFSQKVPRRIGYCPAAL